MLCQVLVITRANSCWPATCAPPRRSRIARSSATPRRLLVVSATTKTPAAIPIWFGTETGETALRRVARLADGWLTIGDFLPHMPRFRQYLREAGRDTQGFPIRASLAAGAGGPAEWIEIARRYQAAGVTHLTISGPPGLASTETTRRVAEVRAVLADALD